VNWIEEGEISPDLNSEGEIRKNYSKFPPFIKEI
jgi:hypothetical protein